MTLDSEDSIELRLACPDDENEFRAVCDRYDPGMADLPTEVFHRRYCGLVVRDDYCLPMAIHGGRAVGYALAQDYGPKLRLRFTIGRLHDLFVAPELRRRGVGRMLMERVFAWARSRPEPMILDWQASAQAIPFYQALGFEPDRVGDYPQYPGFSLDLRASPDSGLPAPSAQESR